MANAGACRAIITTASVSISIGYGVDVSFERATVLAHRIDRHLLTELLVNRQFVRQLSPSLRWRRRQQ